MPAGIKWGENPKRDCEELRRLEAWGLYADGHHERNCPVEHDKP